MNKQTRFAIAAALSCVLDFGCTKASPPGTTVTLQIPGLAAKAAKMKVVATGPTGTPTPTASSSQVQVVIANISAPDINPPIFFSWNNNNGAGTPPTTISMTVPQGNSRVTSVLVVFQDSSGNMQFDYGSSTPQTFSSASAAVTVNLSTIGSDSGQGQISGRYVTATGTEPTGVVNEYFVPPNGAPPMLIQQENIFGGWLDLFGLPGTAINYVFEDGTQLFSTSVNQSSSLLSAPNVTMYATTPASNNESSCTGCNNGNSSQNWIIGYFGPGMTASESSSYAVCYNQPSSTTSDQIQSDIVQSSSEPLYWLGSMTVVDAIADAGVLQGGVGIVSTASAPAACQANAANTYVPFTNFLMFNEQYVASGDQNNGAGGFSGPFVALPMPAGETCEGCTNFLNGIYDGINMNLSWAYLPGATSGLAGVQVFYRTGVASPSNGPPDFEQGNGVPCGSLVSAYGFQSWGQLSISSGITTASLPVAASYVNNGQFQAVVCPYRVPPAGSTNPYFNTGIVWQNGGGGGNVSVLQLNLALVPLSATVTGASLPAPVTNSSVGTQAQGTCAPYMFEVLNGSASYPLAASLPIAFNVTSNGGGQPPAVFTDPNCSAVSAGTYTISAGSAQTSTFYISTQVSQAGTYQVQAQGNSSGDPFNLNSFNAALAVAGPMVQVMTIAGTAGNYMFANGTGATAAFYNPGGVATDGAGNLYVADTGNNAIRKITLGSNAVTTIAGPSPDIPLIMATLVSPMGVAYLNNSLYVVDENGLEQINLGNSQFSNMAADSMFSSDGLTSITTDGMGTLYIADQDGGIWQVPASGGTPTSIVSPVGGQWEGIVYLDGMLYGINFQTSVIDRISLSGQISALAGMGSAGNDGDGFGPSVSFQYPMGIATDGMNLYVGDAGSMIREISISNGAVRTIAGAFDSTGSSDGMGSSARFSSPNGLVFADGNLYVDDTNNDTIRQVMFPIDTPSTVLANYLGDMNGSNAVMATGQCYPVQFLLRGPDGNPAYFSSNEALTLNPLVSTGSGAYYADQNCTMALSGGILNVGAYNAGGAAFFEPSAVSAGASMALSATGSGLSSTSSAVISVGNLTPTQLVFSATGSVDAGTCSQLNTGFEDSVGAMLYGNGSSGSLTATFTLSGISGAGLFSDSQCQDALNALTYGGNDQTYVFTPAASSGTLTITPSFGATKTAPSLITVMGI